MIEVEACKTELGELAATGRRPAADHGAESEILDLSRISAETESLCARVAGQPDEESRAFDPRLEALVAALDALCVVALRPPPGLDRAARRGRGRRIAGGAGEAGR